MSAVCTVKGAVQSRVQYSQGCSTVKGAVQSRVQCSQGCSAVKGAVQSMVQYSQGRSTVKGLDWTLRPLSCPVLSLILYPVLLCSLYHT